MRGEEIRIRVMASGMEFRASSRMVCAQVRI